MVPRRRPGPPPSVPSVPPGGHYFQDEGIAFVPSGCTVLDCVLSGGWVLGRIANVVGDKAVGKTLLAIEACANFARRYPKGHIWYREAEAAFDVAYAEQLGLPPARVDFGPEGVDSSWETVEDIYEDLEACVARAEKTGQPGLYILDSLDALSSRDELKRTIDKGSYNQEKPKVMGALFRRLRKRLKRARVGVIIVSQLRDKIGVMFGEKQTRTGGRALDYYATHILWLHHKATIVSASRGAERATGVRIRAKCKKNKVGPAHRECEFVIRFGYGVDDVEASVGFLVKEGLVARLGIKSKDEVPAFLRKASALEGPERRERELETAELARAAWYEVEERFRPRQRKYD